MKQFLLRHSLLLATLLMLTGTLVGSIAGEDRRPRRLAHALREFPLELGGWQAEESPRFSEHVEARLGATDYIVRSYHRGGRSVELFIGYYADQRAGESMHSPKNCLPGAGWEISRFGTAEIPVGSQGVAVNDYEIQNGGNRAVALYWYQTPERIYANEYAGKLFLVWDALKQRGSSGSIIRLVVPDESHRADAIELASWVIPAMNRTFGRE